MAKTELFNDAKRLANKYGYCSSKLLMFHLEIDFNEAGKLMDELEFAKVIAPFEGSKKRKTL